MTTLTITALICAGCGADPSGDPTSPDDDLEAPELAQDDRPLVDTYWMLAQVEHEGRQLPAQSPNRAIPLRIGTADGTTTVAGVDGCNHFSAHVTVLPGTIELGEGQSTSMACSGDVPRVIQEVLSADEVGYDIQGDRMVLTVPSGSTVLTYDASESPFGPPSGVVVDEGQSVSESFRLTWQEGLVLMTARRAPGAELPGTSGLGPDPGRVNAVIERIDGRPYLMAIVPAGTAQFVYEPARGATQEIALHEVNDPTDVVVGQFVDTATDAWQATAYDADGQEIHRFAWA